MPGWGDNDQEVTNGGWGADDEAIDDGGAWGGGAAQRTTLPDTGAGGGRGGQGGPTAAELGDPVGQRLRRRNPLAATRPFVAEEPRPAGGSVLDRATPEQLDEAARQPLSQAQLVQLSKEPARLEAELKRRRSPGAEAKPLNAADRFADSVAAVSDNPLYRGVAGGLTGLGQSGVGALRLVADLTGNTEAADFLAGASRAGKNIEAATDRGLGGNEKLASQVFSSITQSAPAIVLGVGGGPAMTELFAQTASAEYNTGRNAGFDVQDSLARAGIFGAAEVIGERFGFSEQVALLRNALGTKRMSTRELSETFAKQLEKEIGGEELTTLLQFGADTAGPAAQHPNATLADYLDEAGETFKVTVGQTLLLGGGPAAAGAHRRIAERVDITDPSRDVGRALAQDVANTEFRQAPVDEYARRALSPDFYDPSRVVPQMAPAPRVEDMPTTPFTPEQVAALKAAHDFGQGDAEVAGEGEAPVTAQNAPSGPIPAPAAPSMPGDQLPVIPNGSIAARAEAELRANAGAGDELGRRAGAEPGAAGDGAGERADAGRSVAAAGPVPDDLGGGGGGAVAPAAPVGQDGAVRAAPARDALSQLADQAQELVQQSGQASQALVQRHLRVGFNTARRVMDELQRRGIVSEMAPNGARTYTGASNAQPVQSATQPAALPDDAAAPAGVRSAGDAGAGSDRSGASPAAAGLDDFRARQLSEADRLDAAAEALGPATPVARIAQMRRQAATIRARAEALQAADNHPELGAFTRVAELVSQRFGRTVVPYVDTSAGAADGFMDAATQQVFVNLHRPEASVAFTVFHELNHAVAEEARRGSANAKLAVRMLDQVYAMIGEAERRHYATYLFGTEDAARLDTLLAEPKNQALLREEMLSDFMGKRAEDPAFWRALAERDPATFGEFAKRWISTLADLIKGLLGALKGAGMDQRKDIDRMVKNLERAKLVAEQVMSKWGRAADGQKVRESAAAPRSKREYTAVDELMHDDVKTVDDSHYNLDALGEQPDEPKIPDDAFVEDAGKDRPEPPEEGTAEGADLHRALVSDGRQWTAAAREVVATPAALKAAGIHIEDALPELVWRRGDGFLTASWGVENGYPKNVTMSKERGDWETTTPAFDLLGTLKDNKGRDIGFTKAKSQAAAALNLRTAIAAEVLTGKVDLAQQVSPKARKLIPQAWRSIAQLHGAFRFGVAPKVEAKTLELVQRIADEMLHGSSITARAEMAPITLYQGYRIHLTSPTGGGYGDIQLVSRPKDAGGSYLVFHTSSMGKGASNGVAFYAIAQELADRAGLGTRADPMGLTAVNTFRRTEQMLSAAIRRGARGAHVPGFGQRLYGWDDKAVKPAAMELNLVRLALANLRNVGEVLPEFRESDIRYDLAADHFTRDGAVIDDEVTEMLGRPEARDYSLGRATLARAALTQQMLDGEDPSVGVGEVGSPILYSRRGEPLLELPGEPAEQTASETITARPTMYARASELREDDYRLLADRQLELPVRIADTGETETLTVNARAALRALDDRRAVFRDLIECLSR
jgi:hypothetical protein